MSSIQNFQEFDALLGEAMGQINKLADECRGDAFIESIVRQLKFVHDWTQNGKRPTDEQIKKLSFGTMASKAVDDIDPALAHRLYALADYLDNWK